MNHPPQQTRKSENIKSVQNFTYTQSYASITHFQFTDLSINKNKKFRERVFQREKKERHGKFQREKVGDSKKIKTKGIDKAKNERKKNYQKLFGRYCLAPDLVKSFSQLQMTLLYHPYLQPMPLHRHYLHQQSHQTLANLSSSPIQMPNQPLSHSNKQQQKNPYTASTRSSFGTIQNRECQRETEPARNGSIKKKRRRKSRNPKSKNEKFQHSGRFQRNETKTSEKWIGMELRPRTVQFLGRTREILEVIIAEKIFGE